MARNISLSKPDPRTLRMEEYIAVKHTMVYLDNDDFHAGGTFGRVNKVRLVTDINEAANTGVTMVQPVESDGRIMAFSMPYMKKPIIKDGVRYGNNKSFCWDSYQNAVKGHERIREFLNSVYNGETPPAGAVDFDTGEPLEIPSIWV